MLCFANCVLSIFFLPELRRARWGQPEPYIAKNRRGTRFKRGSREVQEGGAEKNQTQLVKRKITLITKIYINYKGRSSSYQGKVWRASLEL